MFCRAVFTLSPCCAFGRLLRGRLSFPLLRHHPLPQRERVTQQDLVCQATPLWREVIRRRQRQTPMVGGPAHCRQYRQAAGAAKIGNGWGGPKHGNDRSDYDYRGVRGGFDVLSDLDDPR
jgi:hypothetical protein